jgi:hypothetical protein
MALNRIITVARVGSGLTLLVALVASGSAACTGSARARGAAPPPPGLVAVERDVWVVGDADAPHAYYSGGYYWVVDEDRWYRRPAPDAPWVIVETRVVPQRVVVHEHQRRTATSARHSAPAPGYARRAAQQDAIESRNHARQQRAEAERRARERREQAEAEQRARARRQAEQREQRAARDAVIAEQHERTALERQADQQRRQREAQRRHQGKKSFKP